MRALIALQLLGAVALFGSLASAQTGPQPESDPVEYDVLEFRRAYETEGPRFKVVQLDTFDNLNNGHFYAPGGLGNNLKNDGEIVCNYKLEGEIQKGDYSQFYALLELNRHRHGTNTPRLCLDSPGGDRRNSTSISRLLISEKIGTAVPDGALCLSGCSLIFLGGTHAGGGELNRFLHVRGKLGFHAPNLWKVPEGRPGDDFTMEEVTAAYELSTDAIQDLADIGLGDHVNRLPGELFQEMLKRRGRDYYYIDTVGKAIRFQFHLYGRAVRPKLETDTFCNACVNYLFGAWDKKGRGEIGDVCASAGEVTQTPYPSGRRVVWPFPSGTRCAIDIETTGEQVSAWSLSGEQSAWANGLRLPYWYLYPPNTTFSALRGTVQTCFDWQGRLISLGDTETRPLNCTLPVLEPKLIRFVRDTYLGHGKRNHVVRGALLAESVDYYGRDALPRGEVLKSRDAYYARWPNRVFEMIDGTMRANKLPDPGGDRIVTAFEYEFSVARDEELLKGRGVTTLTLVPSGDTYIIARETGEVTKKQ